MARSKKRKLPGGPFLSAAVFCDSVVRGEDGAFSAIRMVDTVTLAIPPDATPEMPSAELPLFTQMKALFSFKRGSSAAKHTLSLVLETPSGTRKEVKAVELNFTGPEQGGVTIQGNIDFVISADGLFWIDVLLDEKCMTRMPLKIIIQRAQPLPAPPAPALPKKKLSRKK